MSIAIQSSAILFPVLDRGMRHVYSVPPEGGEAVALTSGPRQLTHFAVGGGVLLCAMKTEKAPAELVQFELPSPSSPARELRDLTAVNAWVCCAQLVVQRVVAVEPWQAL